MATNYANAKYTEVVDMQTVDGKLSVIGIHTPVGKSPYLKLKGFFQQFRKYRYNGIKNITIVPASGLPIDPLGLSAIPGTTEQMDPRDTFNPILFHGCHGEQLHSILDQLMNDREWVSGGLTPSAGNRAGGGGIPASDDEVSASLRKIETELDALTSAERAYYMWLTDPSWKKFGIQSVVKLRNLYPLVWKMARNLPLLPGASGDIYQTNVGMVRDEISGSVGLQAPGTTPSTVYGSNIPSETIGSVPNYGGTAYIQEFTSGCERLGWLPTTVHVQGSAVPVITALPKLFMGVLVLPPCYSVNQFMRAVIVHSFSFKDFNASLGAFDGVVELPLDSPAVDGNNSYHNWIDYATSKGGTLDIFNGEAELISDGVN